MQEQECIEGILKQQKHITDEQIVQFIQSSIPANYLKEHKKMVMGMLKEHGKEKLSYNLFATLNIIEEKEKNEQLLQKKGKPAEYDRLEKDLKNIGAIKEKAFEVISVENFDFKTDKEILTAYFKACELYEDISLKLEKKRKEYDPGNEADVKLTTLITVALLEEGKIKFYQEKDDVERSDTVSKRIAEAAVFKTSDRKVFED